MIDTLAATWPTEIEAITHAVQLAAPVLVIFGIVWLCARFFQRLIDRATTPRPPPMRTADATKMERETQQLWQRWHETVAPYDDRPRLRAGQTTAAPQQPRTDDKQHAP